MLRQAAIAVDTFHPDAEEERKRIGSHDCVHRVSCAGRALVEDRYFCSENAAHIIEAAKKSAIFLAKNDGYSEVCG
jgi:hypothetical protein